jgi:serine/threonine protein kinase
MSEHELLGTRIGHIRVVALLGQGGMGSVYIGYDERLQRRVALKAIQAGRLDADARARFLREARALSQLRHPNICLIHDYLEGDGRDFLVLELIEGRNLRQVIESRSSTTAVKLRIAHEIASVLAASHAAGIIHRDLKPANVMLTNAGIVKVLDFGLARDTNAALRQAAADASAVNEAESTGGNATNSEIETQLGATLAAPDDGEAQSAYLATRLGVIVGTLSYMSPEQARGEAVTTASDMYSFGLVLQELFTGKSAYESDLRPFDRLAKARGGHTLPVTGLGAELTKLINRLKDPVPSVRPSALDATRLLEWIADGPRRRVRRIMLWAAGLVLTAVAVGMSYQAYLVKREAERAEKEAAKATAVTAFLTRTLGSASPWGGQGRDVTVAAALRAAVPTISNTLSSQPEVEAAVRATIGATLRDLGQLSEAEPLLRSALEIRRRTFGSSHAEVAESLAALGSLHIDKGEYQAAATCLHEALGLRRRLQGPEDPAVAETLDDLAESLIGQGDLDGAERGYREAIAIRRKTLGAGHKEIGRSLDGLAQTMLYRKNFEEGERLSRQALENSTRALGPDHSDTAGIRNNLAAILERRGKVDEAALLIRRSLESYLKVLGPDHPYVASTRHNLAVILQRLGDDAGAEKLHLQVLEQVRTFGEKSPLVVMSLWSLARLAEHRGDRAAAEKLYRQAIGIQRDAKLTSPDFALLLRRFASLLEKKGEVVEARQLEREAAALEKLNQ